MPAPGPDLPLRAREHAHDLPEAHVREADPGVAADRARPRALHPLLPLHAIQRGRGRGRTARRGRPRRRLDDRDVRRRALPRPLQRERHRALPGGRADLDQVPLRGAAVGDSGRADGLWPLPGRLQHQRDHPRGQGQADPLPQPRRGRQRLALRQGPVRVQPPARRGPTAGPAAASATTRLRGGLVGTRARRGRASAPRGERADRHRAVRLGNGRAGLCARQAPASGPRLAHRTVRRRGVGCAGSVPHAAVVDPRRRRRRSAGRRADRRAGSDRRPLDQGGASPRRTRALRARRRGRARGKERDPRSGVARVVTAARPSRHTRNGSAQAAPSTFPRPRTDAASAMPGPAQPTPSRPTRIRSAC